MTREIHGLVLVGGQSRRMGRDKALLRYDGTQTQLERTITTLQAVCPRVFVSQRKEQAYALPLAAEPIYDSMDDVHGPLRGILSAMFAHPDADWLVLACDLPFLQTSTLTKLINHYRVGCGEAPLAYRSSSDGLPEPLCAIYPASLAPVLHRKATEKGKSCPRRLLIQLDAPLLDQDDPRSLDNINTPEAYHAATHT